MPYSSDYSALRYKLIQNAESRLGHHELQEAKLEFSQAINSKRSYSCIHNFSQLVRILEKRGFVGEHSIDPLRKIAKKFNDQELQKLMDEYELYLQNHRRTFFNAYAHPHVTPSAPNAPFYHSAQNSSASGSSFSYQPHLFSARRNESRGSPIPENVIHLICTEIGRHWMELARNLKIREGEIDIINDRCKSDLQGKAREVLKLFESKTDPEKMMVTLLNALVQARRKDLKENVEELLTRRY